MLSQYSVGRISSTSFTSLARAATSSSFHRYGVSREKLRPFNPDNRFTAKGLYEYPTALVSSQSAYLTNESDADDELVIEYSYWPDN